MKKPGGKPDQLVAAARIAHLHDDILALPLGYDTLIFLVYYPIKNLYLGLFGGNDIKYIKRFNVKTRILSIIILHNT